MTKPIVILGYGPVGKAAADLLLKRGDSVRIAQRSAPADLPQGAEFVRCDVTDAASLQAAVAGAGQVVATFGFAYDGAIWREMWPRAMHNLIAACEAAKARLVFFDNLYMYGPQAGPLTEETPLNPVGRKPKARAEATRIWLAARDRVKIAALRAPDFYGPGVGNSHIGDVGFGLLAQGKSATLIAPSDTPHDFAYVPDLGANIVTLLDAPDSDYGQVWLSPCAPTRTPREILKLGADALGVKLRITALPLSLLPVAAVFAPFLREVNEMRFTFDRPYYVDSSKWTRRFGGAPTPFEIGAPATALSFAPAQVRAA